MTIPAAWPEVAKVLAAGASFLALAALLGACLARLQIRSRDTAGRLRHGACLGIAAAVAILVFGHATVLWWTTGLFHAAITPFYVIGGILMFSATSTKPAGPRRPTA